MLAKHELLSSGRREVLSFQSEPAKFFSRAPWQSNAPAKLRGRAAKKPYARQNRGSFSDR
jgi:hypothetical protein